MRVSVNERDGWLSFTFHPGSGEPHPAGSAVMAGRSARFRLPDGVRRDDIHPDLEALAAYLIVRPFIGDQVTFARPVSPALRDALARTWQHASGSTDERLAPRARPQAGRPALAFSGGVDSTAALAVLPESTVAIFCERLAPPSGPVGGRFRTSAALAACASAADRGATVFSVPTDFEHVRSPVGFPTIWANAAAAVLVADDVRADSMSWGIVAESAYGIGHRVFVDWAGRPVNDLWADIFASVALPVLQPVVGVSEVGTASIVRASRFVGIPASCVRGEPKKPCGRCAKCFRKSLLDLALAGESPTDRLLDRLFSSAQVQDALAHFPIKHEDVLTYITARYQGRHPLMNSLRRRVRGDRLDLTWLEHWYGPSASMLPEPYRDAVVRTLDQYLGRMSPEDVAAMQAWDMGSMLEDPFYFEAHTAFVASLELHGARQPSLATRGYRLPIRAARFTRRRFAGRRGRSIS